METRCTNRYFQANDANGILGLPACYFTCPGRCQPTLCISATSATVNARFQFMTSSYFKALNSGDCKQSPTEVAQGTHHVILSGVSSNGNANVTVYY